MPQLPPGSEPPEEPPVSHDELMARAAAFASLMINGKPAPQPIRAVVGETFTVNGCTVTVFGGAARQPRAVDLGGTPFLLFEMQIMRGTTQLFPTAAAPNDFRVYEDARGLPDATTARSVFRDWAIAILSKWIDFKNR